MDPQELIQILRDAGIEELDRSVVDQFLACGEKCVKPLLDVVRSDDDAASTARALTLLGEIGDVDLLYEITMHFLQDEGEEDAVNQMAEWAFQRLIARRPVEALAEIRRLAATADPFLLSDLARHLSYAAGVPGRAETLLTFADRLDDPDFEADDRASIVAAMTTTASIMDGPHSELATSIRNRYGKHLNPETRRLLREVDEAVLKEPYTAEERPDVYQVFCPALIEEEAGPYLRDEPKIGRNDPCWCGSGKKYKKCHLTADEAR